MKEREEKATNYLQEQKIKKLETQLEFAWQVTLFFILLFVFSICYQMIF